MFTWIHEHRVFWRRNRAHRRYINWRARKLGISAPDYRKLLKAVKQGLR